MRGWKEGGVTVSLLPPDTNERRHMDGRDRIGIALFGPRLVRVELFELEYPSPGGVRLVNLVKRGQSHRRTTPPIRYPGDFCSAAAVGSVAALQAPTSMGGGSPQKEIEWEREEETPTV